MGKKYYKMSIYEALDIIKSKTGLDNITCISGMNNNHTPVTRLYFPRYIDQSLFKDDPNICMFCGDNCKSRYSIINLMYERNTGNYQYEKDFLTAYYCKTCLNPDLVPIPGNKVLYNKTIWLIRKINGIIKGRKFKPLFSNSQDACIFCNKWCVKYPFYKLQIYQKDIEEIPKVVYCCSQCYETHQFPGNPENIPDLDKHELKHIKRVTDSIVIINHEFNTKQLYYLKHFDTIETDNSVDDKQQ